MKSKSDLFKLHLIRWMNRAAGMFTKIEKKVVFESFRGRTYSDNPRAVSEKLHELYPDYKIVWGFFDVEKAKKEGFPDYVRACRVGSSEYRKEMATAFAYVRNEDLTEDLYKRKGQKYIQTWHGDRGMKKILYDSFTARNQERPEKVMDEFLTDLFVSGSKYAEGRAASAFRYHGEILKSGCPRNDCLINPAGEQAVREKIGVGAEDKILLYAPTLRKEKVVKGTLDLKATLEHFGKRGGNWVCLVRAHPKSLGLTIDSADHVIDVSAYPDMADLLMIADALITDYSSSAGDFLLRRKPVILAQFDQEEYLDERSFHVDPNEAGFIIAKGQEELNEIVCTMSDLQFAENCDQVLNYFGAYESGHAAEDVCRWIDENYKKA